MVRTGAQVYVKYGWESTYGGSATVDKKFGLRDSVGSWSLNHNRIDIAALNQVTYEKYAYGQQTGEVSIDFSLSNPWIFKTVFGTPSKTGSSDPYTYTYPHASNGINEQPQTFQTEIGFNASDSSNGDIVRTLKGCVANTLAINTSIGQTVDCSLSATYGKEDAPATTFGTAPSEPTVEFPYTFAHAKLTVGGNVLAQVQNLGISFNQTPSLLYGLNSHQAVDSYRQIFDITGNFRASWLDKSLLDDTLNQISKGSSGNYAETVGGSPELEILFRNTTNEEIKITGTGLSPTSISIDGIQPNEPVFENIDWRIKSIVVAAKNNQANEE